MCGITGIFHFEKERKADQAILKKMTEEGEPVVQDLDLGAALGAADVSPQCFSIYVPNKDRQGVEIGNQRKLAIIAGPCALESRAHAFEMANALKEMAAKAGVGLIYKTSFDKANRTSLTGKRGVGLPGALPVFADIRQEALKPRNLNGRKRNSKRTVFPVDNHPVPTA